jgi:hypothetical protein
MWILTSHGNAAPLELRPDTGKPPLTRLIGDVPAAQTMSWSIFGPNVGAASAGPAGEWSREQHVRLMIRLQPVSGSHAVMQPTADGNEYAEVTTASSQLGPMGSSSRVG